MRGMPCVRRSGLGFAVGNRAGVLTERGRLADALEAAREGLPSLAETGSAWAYMHHLALRAAAAGKHTNAARLAGYADATYAARQQAHPPNEARARTRLHTMLKQHLDCVILEQLLAAGSRMSESEACRLALDE